MMVATEGSVLAVQDLHVRFDTNDGEVHAVRGVDCHVRRGECLGVVGESGSGKSQTFLAAMGLLPSNARASGRVLLGADDLLTMTARELDAIRGERMAMIFQNPLTSLTPHLTIEVQMRECLRAHRSLSRRELRKHCLDWLDRVHIPEAARRLNQYPHELSGGMRQRVMIAIAMLREPALLIADEPTTALDVTIQAEILDLMDELRRDLQTAIVLITHDMGVVARLCDRVQVMRSGEYVEAGSVDSVFHAPAHAYTRQLLAAVPRIDAPPPTRPSDVNRQVVIDAKSVEVRFRLPGTLFTSGAELQAVDGIDFAIAQGETLGVVGESGSGKSTLARAALGLIPADAGQISWLGRSLSTMTPSEVRRARADLSIVFQDPLASLDPSMTIGDSVVEPLRVAEPTLTRRERRERAQGALARVGLETLLVNRYPHELSGGQNQRVGIARAMITRPKLVVCDEAVSALDVSIQARILSLLADLQAEFGLAMMFISHDLSVVRQLAHRVLVMYLGSVVEVAPCDVLFDDPRHPYTRQLLSAVPVPDPRIERGRQRLRLRASTAPPASAAARARFMPSRLVDVDPHDVVTPALQQYARDHFVAEHDPLESLLRKEGE